MVKLKIARGLAWNYTSYALEAIVGLGLVAFVVRRVGVPDYGVLTLSLAIASLLGVLDLGLLGLLVQAYVGERTRGGPEAVGRLASSALSRLFASGIAGFAICAVIAALLPGPFSIAQPLVATGRWCLLLVGAALVITLPSLGIEMAYVAHGAFPALSRVQIATVISRAIATVALITFGYGIVALASVHLGAAVLRFLLLVAGLARNTDGVRISLFHGDRDRLRALSANRPWATADNIARQVASAADSITLGILATPAAVATYGVAKRIPGQLLALTNRGIDVTLPVFSSHHHNDSRDELRDLFSSTMLTTAALLIPVCVGGIIVAPFIVTTFAGDRYAAAIPVLRWLLGATLVQAFSVPAYAVLYARAEIASVARISVAEAIANVLLTIALVPRFGGVGAAAATAITHTVGTFGWFLPAAMRAAECSPREFVASVLARTRGEA